MLKEKEKEGKKEREKERYQRNPIIDQTFNFYKKTAVCEMLGSPPKSGVMRRWELKDSGQVSSMGTIITEGVIFFKIFGRAHM